jgi:hypothetical protein
VGRDEEGGSIVNNPNADLKIDAGCILSLKSLTNNGKMSLFAGSSNQTAGRFVTVHADSDVTLSPFSRFSSTVFPNLDGNDVWRFNASVTVGGTAEFNVIPSDYLPPATVREIIRFITAVQLAGSTRLFSGSFASVVTNLPAGTVDTTFTSNTTHYTVTFLRPTPPTAICPPPAPTPSATCNLKTGEWELAATNSSGVITDPITITNPSQVLVIYITASNITISSPIVVGGNSDGGTVIRLVGDFCAKINSSIIVKVNGTQITTGQSQTILSAQCFTDEGIEITVEGPYWSSILKFSRNSLKS